MKTWFHMTRLILPGLSVGVSVGVFDVLSVVLLSVDLLRLPLLLPAL